MERNEICTDFYQIISGSSNKYSRAYTEATNVSNNSDKALSYLKNFIASIENIASKSGAIDKRIVESKGNIHDFVGFDNIEKSLKFLSANKTPVGNGITSDLKDMYSLLEKYKSFYVSGYANDIKLMMREYECGMYLLITGLTMAIAFSFDVTDAQGTTKVVPKPKAYFGVTGKKLHEMVEELKKKDHGTYLDQLEKEGSKSSVNESVYTEGVVDAINGTMVIIGSLIGIAKSIKDHGFHVIRNIKNTVFGVIPLIRAVIYLSYKRKADTILALEQNVAFIEQNVEILTNKNMDPAKKEVIIKKQRAQIEAYKKRAEKLRSQLEEGEKDASNAINAEDSKMQTPAQDDDLVLESAISVNQDNSLYAEIIESARPMTHEQIIAKRKSYDLANKIVGADKKPLEFFGLFNKKKDKDKPDEQQHTGSDKTIDKNVLDEIYKEFSSKYSKESVRLKLKRVDKDLSPTASKIGGHGFWPTGKQYPDEMALLIQINFEDFPNIKDFPTKGILQIFIDNDDAFKGKVFYHDNITNPIDVSNKLTLAEFQYSPTRDSIYSLTGTKVSQCPCCWWNDEMSELFLPIFNKHMNTNIKTLPEIKRIFGEEAWDMLYDKYVENAESWGTRIGGYPNFTQGDVRTGKADEMERLIVQIDSEEGIVFGDYGIANAFISYEDLKAKRFEKAFFTWDCY